MEIAAELQTRRRRPVRGARPRPAADLRQRAAPTGLDRLLDILAEVLTGATYPADEVATERDRLVDRIQVAQSQPAHLARRGAAAADATASTRTRVQTPSRRGGAGGPPGRSCAGCTPTGVHPAGATLVLVGDLQPGAGARRGGEGARRLDRHRGGGR